MQGLIRLFVQRPVTTIMLLAALLIAAGFSLTVMPLERLPEYSVPAVTVETVYPGMAADDIRALITIPIEDSLSPVKGLTGIRSVSRDDRSIISLEFRWGTDPMAASVLVREAVDTVYPGLPNGIRKPTVTAGNPGNTPHAIVAVHSRSMTFARSLAEYEIRARLRRIDGVGTTILAGGEKAEQRLELDVARLSAIGLSPQEFVRLLAQETSDTPAGTIREGNTELVVVSSGRPESVMELSQTILPAGAGTLRVRDAGELSSASAKRESVFVYNGKEAAALEIYRRPGADPMRLSRDIKRTLEEANTFFSADAEISLVYDSTPSMIAGITGLLISAALGITAVIAVLFFFIRRIRWCLIAALSIPVSAAAGISVLAVMGRSLNSMSLGGLALGIGLVSDVSVIVLDLLNRSFEKKAGTNSCLRALSLPEDIHQKTSASSPARAIPSPEDISQKAASIAGSSAASTLTTALVFVPIAFLPGPLGDLFGDMAISLVAAILAGWFYAQFLLPSLYRMGMILNNNRKIRKGGLAPAENNPARALEKRYRKLLGNTLRRPVRVFAIAAAASIAGATLLLFRPFIFISPDAAEEVCISVVFPPGTLLESAVDIGKGISGIAAELPSVSTVYGKAGAEEEDTGRRADTDYRKEEFIFHCVLESGAKPEEAIAEINSALRSFPGIPPFSVYFPLDRTEILLGLSRQDSFVISGKDRGELVQRISLAEDYLKERKIEYSFLMPEQRPELRFFPNREAAAFLSIPAINLAETLYVLNEGVTASTLEIDGKPLNIVVSGETMCAGGEPVSFLEQIPLKTPQGKTVFLGSLGSIERREADAVLARFERSDVSYITLQPDTGKHVAVVFSWFNQTGESVFSRYRNSLLLYVFLVLILLYMTMGAQFESFLLPLILMITIPFSLAGAGPALLITGAKPDSGAILGMAALFGLVVNNSLILFEISEEKIKNGYNAVSAVYLGASERLYAVLITTTTTVFALLPLILSPLGNTQRSMAAAMLGGLAASTLLSLFAIPPVLLSYFNRNLHITQPTDADLRKTHTGAELRLTDNSEASTLRRET